MKQFSYIIKDEIGLHREIVRSIRILELQISWFLLSCHSSCWITYEIIFQKDRNTLYSNFGLYSLLTISLVSSIKMRVNGGNSD